MTLWLAGDGRRLYGRRWLLTGLYVDCMHLDGILTGSDVDGMGTSMVRVLMVRTKTVLWPVRSDRMLIGIDLHVSVGGLFGPMWYFDRSGGKIYGHYVHFWAIYEQSAIVGSFVGRLFYDILVPVLMFGGHLALWRHWVNLWELSKSQCDLIRPPIQQSIGFHDHYMPSWSEYSRFGSNFG